MTSRIGIYSGTFDPVHPGHVAFALETMRMCDLDEVVFLPEQVPREKQGVTDISHRLALLGEVTAAVDGLSTAKLGSEQFNVKDTLPELRSKYKDADLVFLVGSDVALNSLSTWPDVEQLLGEASLAVGVRATDRPEEIVVVLNALNEQHGLEPKYTLIHTEHAGVTSSQIRNETYDVAELNPIIADYIQRHGLYT